MEVNWSLVAILSGIVSVIAAISVNILSNLLTVPIQNRMGGGSPASRLRQLRQLRIRYERVTELRQDQSKLIALSFQALIMGLLSLLSGLLVSVTATMFSLRMASYDLPFPYFLIDFSRVRWDVSLVPVLAPVLVVAVILIFGYFLLLNGAKILMSHAFLLGDVLHYEAFTLLAEEQLKKLGG